MLRHRQTFGRPQIERKITIIRRPQRRRIIISAASFVAFTCPRNSRRVACLVFAPAVAQTLVRGISTVCACPPPLFLLFLSLFSSRFFSCFLPHPEQITLSSFPPALEVSPRRASDINYGRRLWAAINDDDD